jgi:aryl-alcohol dehydrogenase-like predicted oxidoreductase
MMHACQTAGHLTANQIGYNIFDRRVERGVLPYTKEHGIGFMAYGTLSYGLLTGAFTPSTTFVDWDWRSYRSAFGLPLFERENFLKELKVVERLAKIAAGSGRTVAQLAIAWVLGNPAVTVALVGMRNSKELQENVAAADWRLTTEEREQIDLAFHEEDVPIRADGALAH